MSTLIKIIKVLLGLGVALVIAIVVISLIEWRTVPAVAPVTPTKGTTTDSQVTLTPEQSAEKEAELANLSASNTKSSLAPDDAQSKQDSLNSLYNANQ